MIKSTPQIFVVKGKNKGIRVTLSFDTCRHIDRSYTKRSDTLRIIYRTALDLFDTARLVDNMHNIHFDTARKINNDVTIWNDTYRRVHSNNPVYYHSLFVHSVTGSPIECVIFKFTDLFPLPDKYVKVQLDNNNEFGYLPLAPLGSDFDSGLRYTEDNGTVWQICSTVALNIIDTYFVNANYFVNLTDYQYVFTALRNIFDSRVKHGSNCIYLFSPQSLCGITKMFMIGLDIRITWTNDGTEDWDNGVTMTTFNNGVCDTSFGGDNKYKANAMMIKFEPRKNYKIEFFNSHDNISYTAQEQVKGCLIFGEEVEALPEESSDYGTLIATTNYCSTNDAGKIVHADTRDYEMYNTMCDMKSHWLAYTNSRHMYNYYELVNIKSSDLEKV